MSHHDKLGRDGSKSIHPRGDRRPPSLGLGQYRKGETPKGDESQGDHRIPTAAEPRERSHPVSTDPTDGEGEGLGGLSGGGALCPTNNPTPAERCAKLQASIDDLHALHLDEETRLQSLVDALRQDNGIIQGELDVALTKIARLECRFAGLIGPAEHKANGCCS